MAMLGMKAEQWTAGRKLLGLTQIAAARSLKISQPYLSQLESGVRLPGDQLTRKAARLYKLAPTALPLYSSLVPEPVRPDDLQKNLAALGYPGFAHVRPVRAGNPAEVMVGAILNRNLDTRLVEALPWVLKNYTDLNWDWLRDRAKLQNAQNRLGYLVHLARQTAADLSDHCAAIERLSVWEAELEEARLASEGTLCRDSMPEAERQWLRANRPPAAAHWGLLTGITADLLPYAAN
jgi:transcriptional regulator with XRE-family HTH domain